MSIKLKHSSVYSTWFVTFTCWNWINLFEITAGYDLIYNWFTYLRENKKAEIIAYVIMPNHIHLIFYFENENYNLNKLIGNGKRFIAYEFIERLKAKNNYLLLDTLSNGVSASERKKGQLHKCFEGSFDAKAIFSAKFLQQKINYIHYNPVKGKWDLAKDFIEYEHSSASFYELEEVKLFRPLHYMDL
ncbi:MAG: hypothetical protein QM737_23510 [Ferruginibacter sp.]